MPEAPEAPEEPEEPEAPDSWVIIPPMLLAQALVERGMIDSMVSNIWSALMRVDQYVGQGNTKWLLVGLAVFLGFVFFKPRR